MSRPGYQAHSQMSSKPSAGPKAPIQSAINRKASGGGAGNSPLVNKPGTKMTEQEIYDKLAKNNGQKQSMQAHSVGPSAQQLIHK